MDNKTVSIAEATIDVASVYFPEGFSEGSRIVTIKRVERFSFLPPVKEVREEATQKISSTWKRGTRDIIRGLGRAVQYVNSKGDVRLVNEEKLYLADILGTNIDSKDWEPTVKEFWANYSYSIPLDGLDLQIGFKPDGSPISLDGYMKFRFAQEYGKCATSPEAIDNKDIFDFFVVDKNKELVKERQAFIFQKEVDTKFLKLLASKLETEKVKIDYILELIGYDGRNYEGIVNVNRLDTTDKEMELKKVKDNVPDKFVKLIDDVNLATKALLRRAVNIGRISKEGNAYFMQDQRIGSNEMEAIAYLDNPNNNGVRDKLTEAIKDNLK